MTGSIEARSCKRAAGWLRLAPLALVGCAWLGPAGAVHAQEPASEAEHISVEWNGAPMGDVLRAFADFSGKSMVAGRDVGGYVTAYIDDQPWDVALRAILSAHGLEAVEDEHGFVRIAALGVDAEAEEEPIVTRAYRLSFAKASELHGTLAPHLSERGSISVAESTNTLIITDFESVHRTIAGLLR